MTSLQTLRMSKFQSACKALSMIYFLDYLERFGGRSGRGLEELIIIGNRSFLNYQTQIKRQNRKGSA
jgi:hypothetical protein